MNKTKAELIKELKEQERINKNIIDQAKQSYGDKLENEVKRIEANYSSIIKEKDSTIKELENKNIGLQAKNMEYRRINSILEASLTVLGKVADLGSSQDY